MTHQSIEEIVASLSKAMQAAMMHKQGGGCSYRWASMGTLNALRNRGLVGYRPGPGSFYSPHTAIEWPFTKDGLAVRNHLLSKEGRG